MTSRLISSAQLADTVALELQLLRHLAAALLACDRDPIHPPTLAPLESRIAYCIFLRACRGRSTEREGLVQNASVAATELIREAILDGRLEPGVAAEGGGARPRARDQPDARARGAADAPGRGPDRRRRRTAARSSAPTTPTTSSDLYQLRALLEGYAARRAAAQNLRAGARACCARAATASTRSARRRAPRARPREPLLPQHDPRRWPAARG